MEDRSEVWDALANPTRRALLGLLEDGPRTTGDLASRFDMSRFGVMKHLAVLESAGLVVARRSGRRRWNHLDAGPLRRIYEGWLRRFVEPSPAAARPGGAEPPVAQRSAARRT